MPKPDLKKVPGTNSFVVIAVESRFMQEKLSCLSIQYQYDLLKQSIVFIAGCHHLVLIIKHVVNK